MVRSTAVRWIGVEFDKGGAGIAVFGEVVGVFGVFLVVVGEEIAKRERGEAASGVFVHGFGGNRILVEIVFVIIIGKRGNLIFD